MRATRTLAIGTVATGITAAAILNRSREQAIRSFYDRASPESSVRELRDLRIRLPLVYHRADGFWALFPANLDKVRGELSSPDLHPVRTFDGRATFAIGAHRYHDATYQLADGTTAVIEPYAEILMGPLVTTRPAPPMIEALPLLGRAFGLGVDVMELPVTSRQARDGGIGLWGLPKFISDMEFDDSLVEQEVHLSEGDKPILDLAISRGGRETLERQPMVVYSVLDGELLQVSMPSVTRAQQRMGPTGTRLELGSHPVAQALRRLEIDVHPIASVTELESRFFMGTGRPVGKGSPRVRFVGTDRDHGRYVVRHPGTAWIDQYELAPEEPRSGQRPTRPTEEGYPEPVLAS